MLKFRILFSSFLFLLLVGMNSHARAGVKLSDAVENSADDQQPEKKSKETPEGTIITDLDFFGAFSLFNVQLQWRDLTADLNQENIDSDLSYDPHEIFVEASYFDGISVEKAQALAPVATLEDSFGISGITFQPVQKEEVAEITSRNQQQTSIIAFIQNCGTYPKG